VDFLQAPNCRSRKKRLCAPLLFLPFLLLLLSFTPGCGAGRTAEVPWFEEVAAEAGILYEHVRADTVRYYFPEIVSGGAAWLDYDGDGYLDLYLVQGGFFDTTLPGQPTNRLYRNRGDGTFEDVSERAGVGHTGYGMGVAVGDYDGDGYLDLYVNNVEANVLYRNRGDGTFEDVTERAGVGYAGWSSSAVFLDYDQDGHPDLYVVNYAVWSPAQSRTCMLGVMPDYCGPLTYPPASDVLYHNQGDGVFTEVTIPAGIARATGSGLGVTVGDLNGDGWVDIYVANDGMPNQLWINNGDGTFTDRAVITGSAFNRSGMAEAGMGVAVLDLENDGDPDLFMTHLREESNTLYRNEGTYFIDATLATGLSTPAISYTGFGLGFADFDHDGNLDLYIANGAVKVPAEVMGEDPYAEPNQLFRGVGGGRFEAVLPAGGTERPLVATSRAAAFGDYDNDGDVDVVVVNSGGRVYLLRNQVGGRGRWVQFRVLERSGWDAVGAMVRVRAAGQDQWRPVQIAASYLAANDPHVHFGLGLEERIEEVEVVWPGGGRETFGAFEAGAVYELRQGRGIANE